VCWWSTTSNSLQTISGYKGDFILIAKMMVVGALSFAMTVQAQVLHPDGPRPSFAVASIRPSAPKAEIIDRTQVQTDRFLTHDETLRQIITFAYGLGYKDELSGGPRWIDTDRFDIEAKLDEATVAARSKMSRDDRDEQIRLMVQSLLAERFGLKVSFVKKQLPVYVLEIAKSGLKCTKSSEESAIPIADQPRFRWSAGPAPPPPPPGYVPPMPAEARLQTQALHLKARGWPFWLLVASLSHQPELGGRPVLDQTELHGLIDCEMTWSQAGSDGTGESLFTAVQDQMGLKLAPKKAMVETVFVDSIVKPSEN
jgi:uncharacterized protein (TIGR03435 family)